MKKAILAIRWGSAEAETQVFSGDNAAEKALQAWRDLSSAAQCQSHIYQSNQDGEWNQAQTWRDLEAIFQANS
jgi:hypothetical protein